MLTNHFLNTFRLSKARSVCRVFVNFASRSTVSPDSNRGPFDYSIKLKFVKFCRRQIKSILSTKNRVFNI